jgi:hypothetical protein
MYVWNVTAGAATAFEITSGGKTTAFTADQTAATVDWAPMGTFDLKPGATLKILPARSKGFVVADGFALVPAGVK